MDYLEKTVVIKTISKEITKKTRLLKSKKGAKTSAELAIEISTLIQILQKILTMEIEQCSRNI